MYWYSITKHTAKKYVHIYIYIYFKTCKAVGYALLCFLRLKTEFSYFFAVSYRLVKRGNRAGSSRNESGDCRRGPRSVQFIYRFWRVTMATIWTSSFFSCPVRKAAVEQKWRLWLINFFYLATKLKNELTLVRISSKTAALKKREIHWTDLGTSPRVVRLAPRRAGSVSSLYGAKTNLKAKKKNSILQPQKKSPA